MSKYTQKLISIGNLIKRSKGNNSNAILSEVKQNLKSMFEGMQEGDAVEVSTSRGIITVILKDSVNQIYKAKPFVQSANWSMDDLIEKRIIREEGIRYQIIHFIQKHSKNRRLNQAGLS